MPRFSDVAVCDPSTPAPPEYLFRRAIADVPTVAEVGMETPNSASSSSSFVKPVRSFPKRIAHLPPRAISSRIFSHAAPSVNSGKFSRGRAVVATTSDASATASSTLSPRAQQSSSIHFACTANLYASSCNRGADAPSSSSRSTLALGRTTRSELGNEKF